MAQGKSGLELKRTGPLAEEGARPAAAILAEARTCLTQVTAFLEKEVKIRTPIGANKRLRGTIFSQVRGRRLSALRGEVATTERYGIVVEEGRRPGKAFPPWREDSDLFFWVERKFGLGGEEALGASFAVARKIARKGTKGRHMFRDALEDNLGKIEAFFQACGIEITRRLGGG